MEKKYCVHGFEDTTVKMSVLPKMSCRFNTIPIKIPTRAFIDIDKIILKMTWKSKETRTAKTILKKLSAKNQSIQFQDIIISTVTKTAGTGVRWAHESLNRRENPEID